MRGRSGPVQKRGWMGALGVGGIVLANLMVVAWVLLPLLNAVLASFDVREGQNILANFMSVFSTDGPNSKGRLMIPALKNSTLVSLVVVVVNLILGATAGYGLSRHASRTNRFIYGTVLVFRVIPALAVVGPFFAIFRMVGLVNTPMALIIAYTSFTVPLALMTMRNYFDQLPIEIEEAAAVDGASHWTTFWRVTLPIAKPGLGATAVLVFLEAWSEFFYALVLTNRLTVTPALASFQSAQNFDWHSLAAATLVSMVPPIVLAVIFQRSIADSLAAGYDR